MQSKRDDYIKTLNAKLSDWNQDIDRFEARLSDVAETARKEYQEKIAHLRVRYEDCEGQLTRLTHAAGEAWQDMKAGVDDAAEALGSAIKSAWERFGHSTSASSK